MIDIETIKTIATEDWEINWPSKTVLELINLLEAAESQLEAVTQQARMWKMEALTHKATVQECYQACTGSTGEPGDWNGANPVKQLAMRLASQLETIAQQAEQIAGLVATNATLDAEWKKTTADKFAEMAEAIRLNDEILLC